MTKQLVTAVEIQQIAAIMDRVGLANFADAVSAIAYVKAEHVETNWQDKGLASVWNRVARKFSKLSAGLDLNDDLLGYK